MINPITQWLSHNEAVFRGLSQFGITVHWVILQYSIGLWTLVVVLEALARRRKNEKYLEMAKTLSKVAAVIFALGAATGSLSEFGLLLFWPNFLELVGRYFFMPLYLEVFAFIGQVTFIYMYYYLWKKVGPRFHMFLGVMVIFSLLMGAFMIVTANTMMSYPPGIQETYDPMTGEYGPPTFNFVAENGTELTMTSDEVRNLRVNDPDQFDSIMTATVGEAGIIGIIGLSKGVWASFLHAISAAILTTIFAVIGVYSYRFNKVKEERKEYYREGLKIFTIFGVAFGVLQGLIGHSLGQTVARYNPEKFAALEGTSVDFFAIGDLPLVGVIFSKTMAFLGYDDFNAYIPDYDVIPETLQGPLIIHYIYYLKIWTFTLLWLLLILQGFFMFYKKVDVPARLLKLNLTFPFLIQIVSNFGWMTREIGRKPWTIYGVLPVDEAVTSNEVSRGIIFFVVLYLLVMSTGLLLLVRRLFRLKPEELLEEPEKEDA